MRVSTLFGETTFIDGYLVVNVGDTPKTELFELFLTLTKEFDDEMLGNVQR